MNAELNNDTNNNNTVEQIQNQNGAPQAPTSDSPTLAVGIATVAPELYEGSNQLGTVATTDDGQLTTDEKESTNPAIGPGPAAENEPQARDHPEPETTTDNGPLATDHTNSSLCTENFSLQGPDLSDTSDRPDTSGFPINPTIPESTNPAFGPPPTPQNRGRVSKISLLPLEIRLFINEELLYGTPFFVISRALEEKGYPGVNHHNIRSWQAHGFQTWLKNNQSIAQQMHRRQIALAHAQATGCQLDEALYQLHLENLFQAASQLDPVDMVKTSDDKTQLFFKLNEGCVRLLKVGEGLKKMARAEGLRRLQPSTGLNGQEPQPKGGLTLGARANVCKRLGIPHPPVKNPDAIEPEPEEKPSTTPANTAHPATTEPEPEAPNPATDCTGN